MVGFVQQRWIPHTFARLWKSCDSNLLSWLVMMICGLPKQDIQSESRVHDTVSAVMSGRGKASGSVCSSPLYRVIVILPRMIEDQLVNVDV